MPQIDHTIKSYTQEHDEARAKAALDKAQKDAYNKIMQSLLAAHDAGAVLSDEAYAKLADWI